MKNIKKKKGFTIIELIIVIAIIGIIAAIVVPKYGNIQGDAKAKADIATAKVIGDTVNTLISEEKIKISGYSTAAEVGADIEEYLQAPPVVKAVTGAFNVKIDDKDNVVVTVVSTDPAGTFTLYPTVGEYPKTADK